MAVKPFIKAEPLGVRDRVLNGSWTLNSGDEGAPLDAGFFSDRSVQLIGLAAAFGDGTCIIQGSNDGANFATLTDQAGAPLSFTSANLKQVLQITRFIKPALSGTTGVGLKIAFCAARKI